MPAGTSSKTATKPSYGVITLDGVTYIEHPQIFTLELPVTTAGQIFTNQRLTLPGTADFLLKGLSRDILLGSNWSPTYISQSQDRRFRFRLNNAEGSNWFFSGGLGIFDDRVVDTLCFGSGQFPYMLVPPIPVHAAGSLIFEVEDIRPLVDPLNQISLYFPYTIQFGFHGSLLIPANTGGNA